MDGPKASTLNYKGDVGLELPYRFNEDGADLQIGDSAAGYHGRATGVNQS